MVILIEDCLKPSEIYIWKLVLLQSSSKVVTDGTKKCDGRDAIL